MGLGGPGCSPSPKERPHRTFWPKGPGGVFGAGKNSLQGGGGGKKSLGGGRKIPWGGIWDPPAPNSAGSGGWADSGTSWALRGGDGRGDTGRDRTDTGTDTGTDTESMARLSHPCCPQPCCPQPWCPWPALGVPSPALSPSPASPAPGARHKPCRTCCPLSHDFFFVLFCFLGNFPSNFQQFFTTRSPRCPTEPRTQGGLGGQTPNPDPDLLGRSPRPPNPKPRPATALPTPTTPFFFSIFSFFFFLK